MTAARKLAEAFVKYDAALTEWGVAVRASHRGADVAEREAVDVSFAEMLRLAHQILQEETDDKE